MVLLGNVADIRRVVTLVGLIRVLLNTVLFFVVVGKAVVVGNVVVAVVGLVLILYLLLIVYRFHGFP